jgi:hypothetical protein
MKFPSNSIGAAWESPCNSAILVCTQHGQGVQVGAAIDVGIPISKSMQDGGPAKENPTAKFIVSNQLALSPPVSNHLVWHLRHVLGLDFFQANPRKTGNPRMK